MKGKYAAKAANRAATLDNEVIAELRCKLAESESAKRDLAQEIANLRSDIRGEIVRKVDHHMAAERESMSATLTAERDAQQQKLDEAADLTALLLGGIFRGLIKKYGPDAGIFPEEAISSDTSPSLTRLLRILAPDRAGELLEVAICGDLVFTGASGRFGARARRRRTASQLEGDIRTNTERLSKHSIARGIHGVLTSKATESGDEQEA